MNHYNSIENLNSNQFPLTIVLGDNFVLRYSRYSNYLIFVHRKMSSVNFDPLYLIILYFSIEQLHH